MARATRIAIPLLLLTGAGVFLCGINWGLPSGAANKYLFGARVPWSGKQILGLAGPTEDANRGADVASHAEGSARHGAIVNADDIQRARIVRRYRLMSYQPDEWNTLKSLSEMKPGRGNLDPKLYQYGGLWVYPVGAMLKGASLLHLIDLRADVTWYLDHPAAFGRFYIVARFWSVAWAMVGVLAMYEVVRRIVGGWVFPSVGALCFIFMPVVVNMAHEAKPHLAGAVLMLLAVLAAGRYVERGARSAAVLAGALCGAALAMVLTTLPIFLVLPVMTLLRPGGWRHRAADCTRAVIVAAAVYLVTNPYVPYNFLFHRQILESNFGNSKAMYHAGVNAGGIVNAMYLIAAGTSPLLAVAGVAGAVMLGVRAVRVRKNQEPAEVRRRSIGLLLALPAACVMGQCILFASGKPGEFGRFMLLADLFLAVEAIAAVATFVCRPSARFAIAGLLLLGTLNGGAGYLRAFLRDAREPTRRLILADSLERMRKEGKRTLAVQADPAPYSLPPVNLFDWDILLLPNDGPADMGPRMAEVSLQAVDTEAPRTPMRRLVGLFTGDTPISWADKPFDLRAR